MKRLDILNSRVIVVSAPENSNVARERVTGLQAALLGKVESCEILSADIFMDAAWRETSRWLNSHSVPDYFAGCHNPISLGTIKASIAHNLRLMDEVNDHASHARIYGFHFPCVTHDLQAVAWQALNLAIRRVQDGDSKPGKIIVRGRIAA